MNFEEFRSHLLDYYCDILIDNSDAAFHLNKFFKFSNLNVLNMRIFIDYAKSLGWFIEEVAINNLLFRVEKFSLMKGFNDPAEAEDIIMIIEYFSNDLKILSKTQKLALLVIINQANYK